MSQDSEEKDLVSFEELALANAYEILAITALLEQKGILTREEITREVKGLSQRASE